MSTFGILATDGSAGAPTHSFANDTDCGFYRIGANNVGMSVGGAKVVDYSATGVSVTGLVTASAGVQINGGSFAQGKVYFDSTHGLVAIPKTGATSDLTIFNAVGSNVALAVPTGTNNISLPGALSVTGAATFSNTISAAGLPTVAGVAGTLYVDGSGFVKRA